MNLLTLSRLLQRLIWMKIRIHDLIGRKGFGRIDLQKYI